MSNQQTVTFSEAANLITAVGRDVTFLIEGEPGIGKSSLLKSIVKSLHAAGRTEYLAGYMDMAIMSHGDLQMPVINRDTRCTEFFPNESFNLHHGQPVVVMLDELTKASKDIKNSVLPLMLEKRLGSLHLHPDSIVFASGNLSGDGVGDSLQAHARNRISVVEMKKPNDEEWSAWALDNKVHETVIAFVQNFPQVFQCYKDNPSNDNDYIFNPRKVQTAFVSPRSLEKASNIVRQADGISGNALHVSLAGTIGAAAAADLMAFVNMAEQLPLTAQVIKDPKGTKLPDNPALKLLMLFRLVTQAEKDNLTPITTYIERMDDEFKALFTNKVLSTPSKSAFAAAHPAIRALAVKHNQLLY